MKLIANLSLLAALLLPCLTLSSPGGGLPVSASALPEATIDSTRVFDVTAKNGETYRIKVYLPREKPPKKGFSSLYVLDGNILFSTFAAAMRNRSQAGELEPAVIVGIESGKGPHGADRTFDFTSSDLTPYEKSIVVDLGSNPLHGGYDAFFQTIQDEIKPKVASIVRVDPDRTALFGWSLGGLFVLHTMFIHSDAFQTYAALSPSIWRTNRAVLNQIPWFERQVCCGKRYPRLFLGAGSEEENVAHIMQSGDMDAGKLVKEIQYARMTSNTIYLAQEVEPFFKKQNLDFTLKIFEGDTHNSVPWSAINPVLNFIFSKNVH